MGNSYEDFCDFFPCTGVGLNWLSPRMLILILSASYRVLILSSTVAGAYISMYREYIFDGQALLSL